MERARVNGVDLAYEVKGEGPPVLLIHGACIADAMRPLADQLDGYRLIRYHRRGYGESGGGPPADVATHAADARGLVEHLGATPAHIIGYSYGGATALQLAADAPSIVRSLTLLEPAMIGQIPSAQLAHEGLTKVLAPAAEGDLIRAADQFLRTVLGREYRKWVEESVSPTALAQVFADANDGLADLSTLGAWALTAKQAAVITCPTLLVFGTASDETVREALAGFGVDTKGAKFFDETIVLARSLIPQAELVTLPGLNHSLQMQNSRAVAGAVAPFLNRHRAADLSYRSAASASGAQRSGTPL